MVHSEFEQIMYGEKFKYLYDLELKGIYGPENEWDYCEGFNDEDELANLTRSGEADADMKALVQREDGKSIVIDKHLPNSLDNLPTRRSIKRK